jgi:hypothetical protein
MHMIHENSRYMNNEKPFNLKMVSFLGPPLPAISITALAG